MKKPTKTVIHVAGPQGEQLSREMLLHAEGFRQERGIQYHADRIEALKSLDLKVWRVFALRWNLAPPFPGGWDAERTLYAVMHKTRLSLPAFFTEEERTISAQWCFDNVVDLPEGLTFVDGKLSGEALPPSPPR